MTYRVVRHHILQTELGCDSVGSGRSRPACRRNLLRPSLGSSSRPSKTQLLLLGSLIDPEDRGGLLPEHTASRHIHSRETSSKLGMIWLGATVACSQRAKPNFSREYGEQELYILHTPQHLGALGSATLAEGPHHYVPLIQAGNFTVGSCVLAPPPPKDSFQGVTDRTFALIFGAGALSWV